MYLQWNTHIGHICANASKTLGFLQRNLKRCPTDLIDLEFAYFALVGASKLNYGSSVWDPHLAKDKDLLDKVQKRGSRFVCHDYWRDSRFSGGLMSKQQGCYAQSDQRWQSPSMFTWLMPTHEHAPSIVRSTATKQWEPHLTRTPFSHAHLLTGTPPPQP